MYCEKCGKIINETWLFCKNCGHKLKDEEITLSNIEEKNINIESEKECKSNNDKKSNNIEFNQENFFKKNIKKIIIIFLIIILVSLCIIFWQFRDTTNYFVYESLDLGVNQEYLIEFNHIPENILLKSSDSNIIKVEDKKVIALKEGTATIGLYSNNRLKDKLKINSKYIELQDFDLKIDKTLNINSSNDITFSYTPTNSSNKNISIKSSDDNIIKIENGKIIANKEGNCKITATFNDIVKEYDISVITPVNNIRINESIVSMKANDSKQLTVTFFPNEATDKNLTWVSSDNTIISVENGKITAKSAGMATITATTHNGRKASTTIVVSEKSPITINNWTYSIDYVGGVTWEMSITNNTNKTINYITLTWENYNAVEDPIYDTITGSSEYSLQYTGPLHPKKNTGRIENTVKFYNHDFHSYLMKTVNIQYSDGTSQILNESDISNYYDLVK